MKDELTEKQEEERQKLLYWWEDLTDEERTKLLKGYVWEGTIKERYIKLKEMYKVWKNKQTCKNCGHGIKKHYSGWMHSGITRDIEYTQPLCWQDNCDCKNPESN